MKIAKELLPTLSKLLDEALDLEPSAWESWLAALPEAHHNLEPAIRELLARHGGVESQDFLKTLPKFLESGGRTPSLMMPGRTVGPYRLLRELGRGGMGEVWLAERCDGAFSRRVALKLPHAHLSDTLRQRFERERDILAELHHPHIAQLYDAGVGDAQPFLAMELIEGLSITQFCREGRLSLPARLALFDQVLAAVDYAHARLVAHRDLKPANILVTADGQVKLLDFGIAKLLSGPGEPVADLTEFGGRAATPAYAAPEQVAGLPVTTAVDIYAAGVVLYELLVGVRPFGTSDRQGAVDAPLASRRVSHEEALLVGGSDARSLRRQLQGDLDAILAKALEEDPERRYRTAAAFAADLQASRELRPIAARHLGQLAFAARFIRRHRTGSAFSALLLLTLLAGGVGVSVEAERARAAAERERQAAVRAEQAAAHAETEAKRERVIKDFMVSVFTEADPRHPAAKPRLELTAGELVGASAERIEKQFAGDPDTQIQLLAAVTDIFDAVQDNERYRPLHARYIDLMAARYGADDRRVIDAELAEVDHANDAGDLKSVNKWLDKTDASLHRAGLDQSRERAVWWDAKATVLRAQSTVSDERRLALENSVRLFAATAPTDEVYAAALSSLGGIYYRSDQNEKAIEYYRKAVQVLEKQLGPGYGESGTLYVNMGHAQAEIGDFDGAFESLGRAKEIFAKSYGATSPKYLLASAAHARLLEHRGLHAEAMSQFKPLIASMAPEAKTYSNAWNAQAAALFREYYGGALVEDGRAREAIDFLKAALRIYAAQSAYNAERACQGIQLDLAEAHRETGRLDEARHELEVLIAQIAKSRPSEDPVLLRARIVLGRVLADQHRSPAAEAQYRTALREDRSRDSGSPARAYAGLASLALERHAVADALDLSAKSLDADAKATAEPDIRLLPELRRLRAQVLLAAGNAREARDMAQSALEADRRYREPWDPAIAADEQILRTASGAAAP